MLALGRAGSTQRAELSFREPENKAPHPEIFPITNKSPEFIPCPETGMDSGTITQDSLAKFKAQSMPRPPALYSHLLQVIVFLRQTHIIKCLTDRILTTRTSLSIQ